MSKFNYENLANYLLDSLLDAYDLNEVLKILIVGGIETDFLLELGFDLSDIDLVKDRIEIELNEDNKNE